MESWGANKKALVVPAASVRVLNQGKSAPGVTSVKSVKGDNEAKSDALHKSPGIYGLGKIN